MVRGSSKPRATLPIVRAKAAVIRPADVLADGHIYRTPDGERVVAHDRRYAVRAGSQPWGLSTEGQEGRYRRVHKDGLVETPEANAAETWTVADLIDEHEVDVYPHEPKRLMEGPRYRLPDGRIVTGKRVVYADRTDRFALYEQQGRRRVQVGITVGSWSPDPDRVINLVPSGTMRVGDLRELK